jgi:hypothetical protein
MEKVTESVKAVPSESVNFFSYVFNFDHDNKMDIMNMLQYTLLAIIPILLLLKGIKYVVPEEDESKGSLEILAESVGQIILIMLGIWFINRIIRYIPTYSGENYHKFNNINFILPFVIILATMQTKLGAKLNILIDRAADLWHGKTQPPPQQQQQGGVRVSQPFAGQQQPMPQHQPSQADYLDKSQILPSNLSLTAMPSQSPQANTNFNQMYQNSPTPLVNPAFPPEPLAANDGWGGFTAW